MIHCNVVQCIVVQFNVVQFNVVDFYTLALNFQCSSVRNIALHSWEANLLWTFDWRMTAWRGVGGEFLLVFTRRGCRNFLITDSCWSLGWGRGNICTGHHHLQPHLPTSSKDLSGRYFSSPSPTSALAMGKFPCTFMCMEIFRLSTVHVHTGTLVSEVGRI